MLFSNQFGKKSKLVLLFVNSFVILFPLQISVYVMCISLIMRAWCKVDLPRSFVTLGRLSGLNKWEYARVNVLNGDSHT